MISTSLVRSVARAALLLPFAFAAGCQSWDFEATDSRDIDVAIAAGTPIRCETHNGDVQLIGGRAAGVKGVARVTARAASDAEAQNVLKQCVVVSEVIDGRLVLRLEGPKLASIDVAFDLEIPEGSAVDVTSHNGDVTISATKASTKVSNHNGRIVLSDVGPHIVIDSHNGDIDLDLLALEPDCKIETHNADVQIRFDAKLSAAVEASSHNGNMEITGSEGSYVTGQSVGRVFGGGSGTIRVTTHNGNARIAMRPR